MSNYHQNSLIGLSIVRLVLGFVILKNIIFLFPTSEYYFLKGGITPWEDFQLACAVLRADFVIPFFTNATLLKIYLFLASLAAFNFCLGIGSTPNGILLYSFFFFLKTRNGMILDGSDNVTAVVLPFLIVSNCYAYFNVQTRYDQWEQRMRSNRFLAVTSEVCAFAIKVQVAFVYFFTAVAKSGGLLWQNGTAVYYTMRVKEFMATSWNIPLTQNVFFVVGATYSTMLIEIAFPFLIWFRKTKFYIIVATALLHIGIFIFMRIDNFSWVMITTYAVFIEDHEFTAIKASLVKMLGKIRIIKLSENLPSS